VTRLVSARLIQQCCGVEVEWYVKSKNLTVKAILVLDNAPGHLRILALPIQIFRMSICTITPPLVAARPQNHRALQTVLHLHLPGYLECR
jgi:hypothetical protein